MGVHVYVRVNMVAGSYIMSIMHYTFRIRISDSNTLPTHAGVGAGSLVRVVINCSKRTEAANDVNVCVWVCALQTEPL